ncbi:MAG TPA: ABC transporter permease [Gaiellaceae bacterium]|nr:ABC transporter permease [Gaiellaceae bacterium]
MIVYTLRRLAFAVSLVWGTTFLAFVAFGLSFDPLWQFALCRPGCDPERNALIAQFHLHDSILQRYWIWLSGLPRHGFGNASVSSYPIGPELVHAAGVTAQLMALGIVLTLVFSVAVGVVSARRGGPLDGVLRLLAYVSWSLPTFVTGVLLALWLLPTNWFATGVSPGSGAGHWIRLMALPAVTLSLGLIGLYSRYVRTAMRSELRRPYAVVARAKGLGESRVVYRHALRNSLVPFVSVLALDLGAVLGACFAAEWVFRLNGLATFFIHSMSNADPFVLTAIIAMVAVVVAAFSFATDLLVAWLDPRIALP